MGHNVHDALFKAIFSQVEHAAGELRVVLPPGLAARIDWGTLTLRPGSFVDEALALQHSDLLFSATLSGRMALIYVLCEHKSGPEGLTAFQLLRYMVRVWEDHRQRHPEARLLPAIVPVVVHHGEGGWTVARGFEELLDVDEETLADLGAHVVRFRFVLDDLSQESDEALRARAMSALGRLSLWCLRNARRPEQIVAGVREWLGLVQEVRRAPNGMAALVKLWRYVLEVGERFGPEDLVARLTAAMGPKEKEAVVTAGEQLVERGRQEGERKGQQKVLLKMLRARFGELPEAVVAQVNAAGSAELELWIDRILAETAPSLAEVLGAACADAST
jgi:predicted transposase YdaD